MATTYRRPSGMQSAVVVSSNSKHRPTGSDDSTQITVTDGICADIPGDPALTASSSTVSTANNQIDGDGRHPSVKPDSSSDVQQPSRVIIPRDTLHHFPLTGMSLPTSNARSATIIAKSTTTGSANDPLTKSSCASLRTHPTTSLPTVRVREVLGDVTDTSGITTRTRRRVKSSNQLQPTPRPGNDHHRRHQRARKRTERSRTASKSTNSSAAKEQGVRSARSQEEEDKDIYVCDDCSSTFKDRSNYARHVM